MIILRKILELLRSYDWLLIAVVFVLTSIGLAAIYSVDLSRGGSDSLIYVPKQMTAIVFGFFLLFFAGSVHVSFYQATVRMWYFLAVFLLLAVLFLGHTINSTTGWFRFGPVSFQPAEFAKVALIVSLGAVIASVGRRFDRIQYLILTVLVVALPVMLIAIQPDFGSALVLLGIWFGLLTVTVIKKRYLVILVGMAAIFGLMGWFFFFKPYQKERILTFIDPSRDPLNTGYNVSQSIIAIGAGNVFGRGLGFGSQSQLRFLPEAQTDFIFSVIGEEMGFVGTLLLLSLYLLLLWRLLAIAYTSGDDFSAYTLIGMAWFFFIQLCFNIGSAIGLMPVTGVTLPFVSYGGSSLVINCLLIGIAESAFRSNLRERQSA